VVWEGGRGEGEGWGGGGSRRGSSGGGAWGKEYESCRVALAELTPHSPDQSRQGGDGPAPRREEETHC